MWMRHSLLGGTLFLSVWLGGSWGYSQGVQVPIEILSETSIDFTADRASFSLDFSQFTKGATTNTVEVNYTIMANDVVRTKDVVLVKLDDLFPNIALQAQFDSYTKQGGNARLAASPDKFVTVTTREKGLADKTVDEGDGKILDGAFVIRYQAEALKALEAGEYIRTLTVIFADT